MKYKGMIFEIPNAYGNYLSELLEPIPYCECKWLIDNDEIHLLENDEMNGKFLFKDNERIMSGQSLYSSARDNLYYMIFVNLWGFYQDREIKRIGTYREFIHSDCQIIIAVWDCSYVMYWCKNDELLSKIFTYAQLKGYENVRYICESDLLEEKYYID